MCVPKHYLFMFVPILDFLLYDDCVGVGSGRSNIRFDNIECTVMLCVIQRRKILFLFGILVQQSYKNIWKLKNVGRL
jgi:hypothetical protein